MIDTNQLQARFTTLRSNKIFELFVVAVIIGSALLVGAKTYDLHPVALTAISWLDHFITAFFLVEISIRFLGEENKRDFFKNPWNVFDTMIVTISLVPIENSDMALVARLVRVFRVLRMVSIIPELRMLLNSLVKALPQLGYVLLLMFIIFYVYGAVGSTLFSHINPDLWGDISISLLTLFRVMTFEDWTDIMYETMEVYPLSWSYYLTFIFFTAFAFLNMVIGIVVNVMNDENEKLRKQKSIDAHEPTLGDLNRQLEEVKQLIERNSNKL